MFDNKQQVSSSACHLPQSLLFNWVLLHVRLSAMGPTVEVVEGAGLIRAMVSHPARVTASRATEATARAPTTTLAPTTREATAATAKPSQVGQD